MIFARFNFKTLPQTIQQLIHDKEEIVATNPIGYMERMQKRIADDPALVMLCTHYGTTVTATLPLIPKEFHNEAIKTTMAQVIQDWEDGHRKFEEQLRPGLTP